MLVSKEVYLINFRDELLKGNKGKELNANLLRNNLEFMVLGEFFDILDRVYNPKEPVMQNTDGNVFCPCNVLFKLKCTPQEALNKLLQLTLDGKEKDFLSNAEYDQSGKIVTIFIPWLKRGNKKHKS